MGIGVTGRGRVGVGGWRETDREWREIEEDGGR